MHTDFMQAASSIKEYAGDQVMPFHFQLNILDFADQ
jgi:hypothetical protein